MEQYLKIVKVKAREVLDSRGNPTVEAEVTVKGENPKTDFITGRAAVPSGASTGKFEAVELRDKDKRYCGAGVRKAVENINDYLNDILAGQNALNQRKIDRLMIEYDGTDNKEKMGANAILAVSLANLNASAKGLNIPVYKMVGGMGANTMPIPMMNILNGGAHASNNLDVQEFMILPVGACTFKEGVRWCTEVYHCLKNILKEKKLSVAVGDEGGFAPDLSGEDEALEIIMDAIEMAGYKLDTEFKISLDVAASEWKTDKTGFYKMPKKGIKLSTDALIEMWANMTQKYPIFSIEDPLDEEDWEGWSKINQKLGDSIKIVGDDLFVTNVKRLKKGIEEKSANAILIKPNQIGSVTETIKAVQMAQKQGMTAIMSHRSGETEDTIIADLAVGLNTGYIKTGAPCRSERTAKYNQLIRIEEKL